MINQTNKKLLLVSVGRHTRLGDILEYALAGVAFETVETEAFLHGDWMHRRVLFAISTGETDDCAGLHALIAAWKRNDCFFEGCVCAAIVDGAQGRLAHLDTLALLLEANRVGAMLPPRPLLEGDWELRYFSGGRESSFERYRVQARSLVERLMAAEPTMPEHPRVRPLAALEDGPAQDWLAMLKRMTENRSGVLVESKEPDETILVCENTGGLPDDRTLSLLDGGGRLGVFLASPAMGAELYIACVLEHACLRGDYSLTPRAMLVFEGYCAVEVAANKGEM